MDEKRLAEIESRARKATAEPIVRIRYDHGGGRAFKTPDGAPDSTPRDLILDCYDEKDREFYFHALCDVNDLARALRDARSVQAKFEDSKARDLGELLDALDVLAPFYLHAKALRAAGRTGATEAVSKEGASELVGAAFLPVIELFEKYGLDRRVPGEGEGAP